MTRSNAVIALALGTALAACRATPEKTAAQPSPNPPPVSETTTAAGPAATPAGTPGLEATPTTSVPAAPVAGAPTARTPREGRRTSARTRTAESAHHAPAAAGREPSRRSDRVERVDHVPPPEPIDIPPDRNGRRDEAAAPTAREPNRDRISIPAGTELQLVLESGLSSATSQKGDPVTARVARASGPDGNVLLPGGTVLKGHVFRADQAGRVSGKARLAVDFDRIVIRGEEHRLDTTAIDVEGPDSHGRDAAIIGGSTVGGAIVGAIMGGGNGAKKGAVVGAIGGTGAVLATRGREVEIPAGSHWTVRVKNRVPVS